MSGLAKLANDWTQAMALLTAKGVKEVFQCQKPEGREHLRRLLSWGEIDELRDSRRSILLDTLYESIIFAAGRGFPWMEVVQVVKFTEELLKEAKAPSQVLASRALGTEFRKFPAAHANEGHSLLLKGDLQAQIRLSVVRPAAGGFSWRFNPWGCSITEAVAILGDKLRDYQRQFNTTHLLALCDYFHNTFIRHYRLFQYILGQDQEVNLTVTHLEVCVPLPPLPLAAGVDREVWKHEQQVAELQVAEVQKRTHMLLLKEAMTLEQGHLLQKAFEDMPIQSGQLLRREELENLIGEALRIQMEYLQELLQCEIQTAFDILDLKLQKKSLQLNAPTPFPPPITSKPGQDESLKPSKASKGKKAKGKK